VGAHTHFPKAEKRRTTLHDWSRVAVENATARQMAEAEQIASEVCAGERGAVLIYGPPGFGKTRLIKAAVKRCPPGIAAIRAPLDIRTVEEVMALLAQADARHPVIFEECDGLFSTERKVNGLKRVLDEEEYSAVPWEDDVVDCSGPKLFTSNKDWDDPKSFPSPVRAHMEAITSRIERVKINFDPLEAWEYCCFLAICRGMIQRGRRDGRLRSREVQNQALRWFTENLNGLDEVSPRRLVKIAEEIARAPRDQRQWESRLRTFYVREPYERNLQAQPVPEIVDH
jgi:hypothetical protein